MSNDELATNEDFTTVEFKPIDGLFDDHMQRETVDSVLLTLRAAVRMAAQSKPQLIESIRQLGTADTIDYLDRVQQTVDWIDDLKQLLQTVEARVMSAAFVLSMPTADEPAPQAVTSAS